MNLSQLFSILMARKLIVVWVFLLTVITTAVISFLLPKTYTATASLVINSKGSDPITGNMMPSTMAQNYMATQVDIIKSRNVALKVVEKLGITSNPNAKEQFESEADGEGNINNWFADRFLKNLTVEPSRESTVVQISYQASNPELAAALTNAFAEAYINTNLQLKIEPSKQTAAWFDQQIKGLRQNVERAQDKLSAYQKENNIAFSDERLDIESARLNSLSTQLVAAQAQTIDAVSKQNQLQRGSTSEAPDVLANGLIQGLKSQLVQAESRLAEASGRLGENHPIYIAAKAEVSNIRNLIGAEMAKTSSSVSQTTRVSQQTERQIESALSAQKEQVLKSKTQHDAMAVLVREVESAQLIYDNALLRFSQTNMESQSGLTDISILNPAVAPAKHSSPKITMNILLSFVLGTLLAMVFAIAVELLDRRVRSAADLVQFLDLPVLAELGKNQPKKLSLLLKLRQLINKDKSPKRHLTNYQFIAK